MLATALAAACLPATAACLSDTEAAALVANYLNKKPAANPEGLNDADAACTRAKFNNFLAQQTGAKVVGYKAGLTNPAVQKRFNATAPVWGVLYEPMLLKDGATVEAAFGARPLFEADLLVRVADAAHQPGEDARAGAAVHRPGDPGDRAARPGGRGAAQAQRRGASARSTSARATSSWARRSR